MRLITSRVLRVFRAFQPSKLLEQFGTLNEEKTEYTSTSENRADFEKHVKELNCTEAVLPMPPVKLADLQGFRISGADLQALKWLLQE